MRAFPVRKLALLNAIGIQLIMLWVTVFILAHWFQVFSLPS
jgi:hypothetical protein